MQFASAPQCPPSAPARYALLDNPVVTASVVVNSLEVFSTARRILVALCPAFGLRLDPLSVFSGKNAECSEMMHL